jgi:hypothetical protein
MLSLFLDSFWRALAYCFHPRVIAWSLLPLALILTMTVGGLWYYGDEALLQLQGWLSEWGLVEIFYRWLDHVGQANLRTVLVPLLLLMLILPVVIVLVLLTVAWLIMPAMVRRVAVRRFPALLPVSEGFFWRTLGHGLGSALLGLVALALSVPLWLIPPLVLVLPPVIWGWLTARIMVHDALVQHASADELRGVLRRHRLPLLCMGVVVGFMGAIPGTVWMAGAVAVVFAPLLMPLAIWAYTFIFIFAALWFSHYALAALTLMRQMSATQSATAIASVEGAEPAGTGSELVHD